VARFSVVHAWFVGPAPATLPPCLSSDPAAPPPCSLQRAKDVCIGQEVEVGLKGPGELLIQWIVTQIAHVSHGRKGWGREAGRGGGGKPRLAAYQGVA
jgi:hypothetical protein